MNSQFTNEVDPSLTENGSKKRKKFFYILYKKERSLASKDFHS